MPNDSSIFSIFTLQQRYLDMQDGYMPGYSLPTKKLSRPEWKKVFFYANATTGYQSKQVCVGWIGSEAIDSISKQGIQHNVEQQKSSNWVIFRQKSFANIVAAFRGMHVSPAKHSYAWLSRKCDYRTDRRTHTQTDAGQSDPYVPLCFADDTKTDCSSLMKKHTTV